MDALGFADDHLRKSKTGAYEKALDRYFWMMSVFPSMEPSDRPAPPEPPSDL